MGWQPVRRRGPRGAGWPALRTCGVAVCFVSEAYTASQRIGTSYVDDDVLERLCGAATGLQVRQLHAALQLPAINCVSGGNIGFLSFCAEGVMDMRLEDKALARSAYRSLRIHCWLFPS